MKQKWLLALVLPFAFLLTTGQSCNDCTLDTNALSTAKEQLTSVEKSKQVTLSYNTSKGAAGMRIPTDCKCLYTGDDLEKVAAASFNSNVNDPLMLSPVEGTDKVPSLDPRAKTFSQIGIFMGCLSCTGVNGGGRTPPPPPPPTGDEELTFNKISTAIIGPDPAFGTKATYLELNLLKSSNLGGKTFSDLLPQDAWKGDISGKSSFVTNRNGYTVAVIDLGSGNMLRMGSFDSDRVATALNQFSAQ